MAARSRSPSRVDAAPRVKAPTLTTRDAKLLSFAYSASNVSWNRFCNMWLLKCGFSPREVGLMKSLSLIGKLVAQPLWAAVADAGSPPDVLAASVVASCVALECLRRGTRSAFAAADTAAAPRRGVGAVALLRVFRSAASAASPVADAMVLSLARDGGEAWGRQRFWGSASWGLGSVVVGALIDRVGLEAGLFGANYVVTACLVAVLVLRLRPRWPRRDPGGAAAGGDAEAGLRGEGGAADRNAEESRASAKARAPRNAAAVAARGLVALRRSPPLRLALASGVGFGCCVVVVDSILYMQLEAELGVSRTALNPNRFKIRFNVSVPERFFGGSLSLSPVVGELRGAFKPAGPRKRGKTSSI